MRTNSTITSWLSLLLVVLVTFSCSEDKIENGATGTITGSVVANGSNEPLANVRISTQPVSTTVFTDAEGNFRLNEVLVGDYSVEAQIDNFVTKFEPAVVTAGRTSNVIFELETVETENTPPSIPLLISPENNATNQPLNPQFVWSSSDPDADDSVTYNLRILNDQGEVVGSFETVNDTVYDLTTPLAFSTQYFWQVSANDQTNPEVQSEVNTFSTTNTPNAIYNFVQQIGDNNVIFGVDDENNLVQLTDAANNSFRPRKNAQTNKIAYLQSVGAQTHLFVMNEDGSNKQQLTSINPVNGFDLEEIDFAWEPNGSSILFPQFETIYQVNADGSGSSPFYTTTDGSFVSEVDWSEFNDQIAVKTNNNLGYEVRIFTMNTDGSVVDVVLEGVNGGAGGLNFNVDGSRLLYAYDISGFELPDYRPQDTRLFVYDSDTDTSTMVNTNVTTGFLNLDPRFSPNEDKIIYTHKGRSPAAIKRIFIYDFNDSEANGEELIGNSFMPDWED